MTTENEETTYPLRAAARLTGLSAEVLRAWERRYGVVEPQRTAGGSRRYTAADLEKLRLLKAAVDAGHRIGRVAQMSPEELQACAEDIQPHDWARLDDILDTVDRLASNELRNMLALQMSTLGPSRFAREFAAPLLEEVGARWSRGELSIAHEHLLTSHLRSLLGAAMLPSAASIMGPRVIFATPPGELHELGLLMAALTALGAGADPLYLGAQVPAEEVLAVAQEIDASAVAVSIVNLDIATARSYLLALRSQLPSHTRLLVGGNAADDLEEIEHVDVLSGLERFEGRITLLGMPSSVPTPHAMRSEKTH